MLLLFLLVAVAVPSPVIVTSVCEVVVFGGGGHLFHLFCLFVCVFVTCCYSCCHCCNIDVLFCFC